MNPMDAQRYDLSKRNSPAREENNVSDAVGASNVMQPVVHDASSIEARSALLPAALTSVKPPPLSISQQRDAFSIPLPISPPLSPSHGVFMEGDFPIPDTLNKDSLIKFPVLSEDDSKSRQLDVTKSRSPRPSLTVTSPRVSHKFMQPMQPLFLRNDGSERIFSPPSSPAPVSPPLSPQSRPTSPHFWKSACPSPTEWPTRPLSPPYCRVDDLSSERWDPMSCPTSPLLPPSNPPPSPTSPSLCDAKTYSIISRRLRALGSTASSVPVPVVPETPVPGCRLNPFTWPTSPIRQGFSVDNWVSERDPTEGIDVIEIKVTKEISFHIEDIKETV